jgi:carboxyl-terminal processing protease
MLRIILAFFLASASFFVVAQQDECTKAKHVINMLGKVHYDPPILDSNWSNDFFYSCFDALDPSADFFTEEDLNSLKKYRTALVFDIEKNSCDFIDELAIVYGKSIRRSVDLISVLSIKKLDFTQEESMFYSITDDGDFNTYAEDDKDLEMYWRKNLKFRTLVYWVESKDSTEFTAEKQSEYQEKAKDRYLCRINRKLLTDRALRKHVAGVFLEQLALSYDSHTNYFSLNKKDEFEDMLSVSSKSFGIILDENEGTFSIDGLVPGSAAWNSNELHEGDIIISITFEKEEATDFSCMSSSEFMNTMNSKGDKLMSLTVRKVDGQKKTIELVKTEIDVDDNVITSFVLVGEKKIGYINLPSFYTDFESDNAPGCANDVAKELIKLKREGVDGIILDLRYNGGGSMREARDLAGIFIDQGGLGMSRNRDELPVTLKDLNRGTMYNGPLTILVNGYSASASEFVAAAIQDHHRGIIVGDTTYGKATGQQILPLGKFVGDEFIMDDEPDYVKTTAFQLYRVTGVSLQGTGVVPDVCIPDPLKVFYSSEADYANHILADTVMKKVYYTPNEAIPIADLKQKSTRRIASDSLFSVIVATQLDKEYLDQELRLSPEYISEDFDSLDDKYNSISALKSKKSSIYEVVNNKFDQEVLTFNSFKKDLNKQTAETISKDVILQEAYSILLDLIQIQTK